MTDPVTCDTSLLVPALTRWHPDHATARAALAEVAAVPAHVVVECYSVLTRLPAPHRLAADIAGEVVARLPFRVLTLPGDGTSSW